MKSVAIVLVLALGLLGCEKTTSALVPVETKQIAKGNLLGAGQEGLAQQNFVITDPLSWSSIITKMNSVNIVSDSFSEVNIDFSEFQVIAVFDDVKGSGGHAIDISVASDSQRIVVTIKRSSPQGNATAVMTQPYHIVKIPVSSLPVEFK